MKQLTFTLLLTFLIQMLHAQYNYGLQVTDLDAKITGKLNLDSKNSNLFIGLDAGINTVQVNQFDGESNTFIGKFAGFRNTEGSSNTFIGNGSGYGITTGGANTFIGTSSGNGSVTSGLSYWNIAIGYQSGRGSGNTNIFIGNNSGRGCDDCSHSIFLGHRNADFADVGNYELFIENNPYSTTALLHGDFWDRTIEIDGELHVEKFLKLTPNASAPTSPEKGTIYYDSTDDKVKVWTGSAWENLFFHTSNSSSESSFNETSENPCNSSCLNSLKLAQKEQAKLKLENQEMKIENQHLKEDLKVIRADIEKLKVMVGYISKNKEVVIPKINQPKTSWLEQNTPNPFREITRISYFVSPESKRSNIHLSNSLGQVIKVLPIASFGKGELELKLAEFSNGTFYYSLEVDGIIIDTKKIVLLN